MPNVHFAANAATMSPVSPTVEPLISERYRGPVSEQERAKAENQFLASPDPIIV
ncbi:hypothetical protein MAL1_00013 [Bacteriophage DSS3_MAL1]|nr:hypothetical protein MAL1_00013 [Bacteriophage DSS3_MAL1]